MEFHTARTVRDLPSPAAATCRITVWIPLTPSRRRATSLNSRTPLPSLSFTPPPPQLAHHSSTFVRRSCVDVLLALRPTSASQVPHNVSDMSADPSAIHHHHPAVVAAPSTTRPASSSVIFRSALYNNIATVADDNPLHEPLPILTPPSTPAQLDRSSLQPVHLLLPSALTRGTGSSVSTAVITLRDGTPAASTEAAGDGMRRRMATGGRVVEKTVITQTTVVTRAKSRIDEEEEEEAGDDEVGSRQDSGARSAQSSASKGSSFRP